MHVLFCLPDLEGLGVQRVVASLAQAWPHREARLSICVNHRRGKLLGALPAGVPVLALDELAPDLPKLRVLLRPLLHRRALQTLAPDVVVSFTPSDNLSLLAACKLLRRPPALIVSEHIHVSSQLRDYRRRFRWPYRLLLPRWYPQADAILCVAEASKDDLALRFGLPREKLHVIQNPIELVRVREAALAAVDHPFFAAGAPPLVIGAGRLEPQKRFDLLIAAFSLVRKERECNLAILGEGPLRAALQAQAAPLGEHVWLAGFQANPFRFLARASVFALCSDYEGFPMVLAEAMALAVPAVSTDCPSGPREMLDGGKRGLLVPTGDAPALAAALLEALRDCPEREARRKAALQAADALDAPLIAARYLALARRVLQARA